MKRADALTEDRDMTYIPRGILPFSATSEVSYPSNVSDADNGVHFFLSKWQGFDAASKLIRSVSEGHSARGVLMLLLLFNP